MTGVSTLQNEKKSRLQFPHEHYCHQLFPYNPPTQFFTRRPATMASINYLLYESAAGYAVFKVENQADSVGLQLKEVQSSLQNLATFSKHVKLVSFAPYQYVDMVQSLLVASRIREH